MKKRIAGSVVIAVTPLLLAMGILGEPPALDKAPEPKTRMDAVIVDMDGVKTDVSYVSYDGELYLPLYRGKAIVTVPFKKISNIAVLMGYDLIDIEFGPTIDLIQAFELDPDLFVELTFDRPVELMNGDEVSVLTSRFADLPEIALLDDSPVLMTPKFFIEALFGNVKTHPFYPGGFKSFEEAYEWCRDWFDWYNNGHHHCALELVTPVQRHSGEHVRILEECRRLEEESIARRRTHNAGRARWRQKPSAAMPSLDGQLEGKELPRD